MNRHSEEVLASARSEREVLLCKCARLLKRIAQRFGSPRFLKKARTHLRILAEYKVAAVLAMTK